MAAPFLTRFTPGIMDSMALEATYVHDESLPSEIIKRVQLHARGDFGRHLLIMGPEGVGKSHLLSLTYYRTQVMSTIVDQQLLVWFRECEWGITSTDAFLLRVLESLDEQYSSGLAKRLDEIRSLGAKETSSATRELFDAVAGDRALVVFVERFEEVLKGLASSDRRDFLAYLGEHPRIMLVATSRHNLSEAIPRMGNFASLFDTLSMDELTADEASRLVLKIVSLYDEDKLLSEIASSEGRAFLNAIHHMCGGISRVFVILAQNIVLSGTQQKAEVLLSTLDALLPQQRARMLVLSPQQRKIVDLLCLSNKAMTVKEISRNCGASHQTCSSQLKSLRDLDYVHSIPIGRESYYEMRDDILRLCNALHGRHRDRVSTTAKFLRVWFGATHFDDRPPLPEPDVALPSNFLEEPLLKNRPETKNPKIATDAKHFLEGIRKGDLSKALHHANNLVDVRGRPWDYFAKVHCLCQQGGWSEALGNIDRTLAQNPDNSLALSAKGYILFRMKQYGSSMRAIDHAITLKPKHYPQIWSLRAAVELDRGNYEEAIASCEHATGLQGKDPLPWYLQGLAEAHKENFQKAIKCCESALKEQNDYPFVLNLLGVLLCRIDRPYEALRPFEALLNIAPQNSDAWGYRGAALLIMGAREEALKSFTKASEEGTLSPYVGFQKARLLFALDRREEGYAALTDALEKCADRPGLVAGASTRLLEDLLSGGLGKHDLESHVVSVCDIYERWELGAALGAALVASARDLPSLLPKKQAKSQWVDMWKQASSGRKEIETAVGILNSLVRYWNLGSRDVLLALSPEERKLVELEVL